MYSISEEEDEQIQKPNINCYVLVSGEKDHKIFCCCSFEGKRTGVWSKLKKKRIINKFVFPAVEDVSVINTEDIISVLKLQSLDNRESCIFNLKKHLGLQTN